MTDTVASENQPGLNRKYEKKKLKTHRAPVLLTWGPLNKVSHCTKKHNTIY